jgi:hypothetical protein
MALALALVASVVLSVTPKHGIAYSTYVISFKAPYATSKAAGTDYGIGAVNSANCTRGISSFGRIQYGPYKKGQTVRFVIHYPRKGLCVGVFHGVVKYQHKEGDRILDRRLGRFGFRVLSR